MRNYFFLLGLLALPTIASAHEVYVLTSQQIRSALETPAFDGIAVALQNWDQFIFWAFIAFLVVSTVFFASLFRLFETRLTPLFVRSKRYAHDICRITVALGILASAYNGAAFGPELPLMTHYSAITPLMSLLLALIGFCLLFNLRVRDAALAAVVFFLLEILQSGLYLLTYMNYLGEFLVLVLMGTRIRESRKQFSELWYRIRRATEPYVFLIIRVSFGISFLFSSLYAKVIHNNLALDVAALPLAGHAHSLAYSFGFEPHFLVLGAAIIEILIALFFIFGIEIRWTCLFVEFWLALSLWYFGESVWPHLILIGMPIALFLHGYDAYTLEGWYFRRRKFQPIL